MTQIRLESDIYTPYKKGQDPILFDPTEWDGPDAAHDALSAKDLAVQTDLPSIEEIVRRGVDKNRLADDMNRTMIRALRHHAEQFGPSRFKILAPADIKLEATAREALQYAAKVVVSKQEQQRFLNFVDSSESVEPFVAQVLEVLAKDKEAQLAGSLFDGVADPKKQSAIFSQMQNIGVAARILFWAEASARERNNGESGYNERCKQWALADPKLALIVGTESGVGLDIDWQLHQKASYIVEIADKIFQRLHNYYALLDNKAFERLIKELDYIKKVGEISDFRLDKPDAEGRIGRVEVCFSKSANGILSSEDRARNYEKAGEFESAAIMYEFAGDLNDYSPWMFKAAEMYSKTGDDRKVIGFYLSWYLGINPSHPVADRIVAAVRDVFDRHSPENVKAIVRDVFDPYFLEKYKTKIREFLVRIGQPIPEEPSKESEN